MEIPDPTTAVRAGISLYEAGGFALLLLGVFLLFVAVGFWFLIKLISGLSSEIRDVRNQMVAMATGVIKENTASNVAVVAEVAKQTGVIRQQSDVLRERLPPPPPGTFHAGRELTPVPG